MELHARPASIARTDPFRERSGAGGTRFQAEPKWSPPNLESEPLAGLEGRVWIDQNSRRLVQLEAASFTPSTSAGVWLHTSIRVATVTLQQAYAGNQRWIVEHLVEQFSLSALMVRREAATCLRYFRLSAGIAMSYQQAIKSTAGYSAAVTLTYDYHPIDCRTDEPLRTEVEEGVVLSRLASTAKNRTAISTAQPRLWTPTQSGE